MKNKIWVFFIVIAMLFSCMILAQSKSDVKSGQNNKEKIVIEKKIVRFDNMGRQDPFVNLEMQKKMKSAIEAAKLIPTPPYEERQKMRPGVRGMLLRELRLQGIVKKPDETVAYFTGVDKKAHFLRKGDELYNAKVIDIKKNKVVFEVYKRYLNKKVEKTIETVKLNE